MSVSEDPDPERRQSRIDCAFTGERYTVTVTPRGTLVCPGCDREWPVA